MTPIQMQQARQKITRMPPLNSKIDLDCCSYAARRMGPGVLGFVNASPLLRNAFGNWKDATQVKQSVSAMADKYTEEKLKISFGAKFLVAEVVRRAIRDNGSANFQWHQTAQQSDNVNSIVMEAQHLSGDVILPHRESEFARQGLTLAMSANEFLDAEEPGSSADPHVPEDDLVTPFGREEGQDLG